MSETLNTWIEATHALLDDEDTVLSIKKPGNGNAAREALAELHNVLRQFERIETGSKDISPGKEAAAKSSRSEPNSAGKHFDEAASKAHEAFTYGTTGKRK